jgi:glycosyltransferase involved in cell wall biosynthesis
MTLPAQPSSPVTADAAQPLVSVIIPVYQGADFIEQAVRSVLDQTWRNLEVIVVDDGSTDDTVARARAIDDPRVRVLQQANAGASHARNRGFEASRGELIQFLDHDDILHPRKLETQARRLLESGLQAIACCTWERFSSTPAQSRCHPERTWRDDAPLDWLLSARGGQGMMPTGVWLTPRTLIEAAGLWDVTLPGSLDDDGEFFSRCVLASRRVLFCADAIFYYRDAGSDNLRLSRSERDVRCLLMTQQLYERRFLAVEDSPRVRRTVAHGYAAFLEMVYPAHPARCAEAFQAIDRLGGDFDPPGSRLFAALVTLTGLKWALRIRQWMRRAVGRPLLGGWFTPSSERRRAAVAKP